MGLGVGFEGWVRAQCSEGLIVVGEWISFRQKMFQVLYFISNEAHGCFFSNSWTTFLRRGRAYSIAVNRRRPKRISIWSEVKIRRSDIFIDAQSLS